MKKIIIFLIPVAFFVFFEASLRNWGALEKGWFKGIEYHLERADRLDVLFIGSSRVAASVDPKLFEEVTGRFAYNLGTGFSTLHANYFLIRKLYERYPEKLKGLTVMLEAPFGLPGLYYWSKDWFEREQPQYLVEVMSFSDIKPFLLSSSSLEDKLSITFRLVLNWSYLFTYREKIRQETLKLGSSLLKDFFIFLGFKNLENPLVSSLSPSAGLRTDIAGIKRLREIAESSAKVRINNQRVFNLWSLSVVQSLKELLSQNGGQLVLYNIPLSPIQRLEYHTEIMGKNIQIFKKNYLDSQSLIYLNSSVDFSEEDFPDLWHLGLSKQKDFTLELAKAFNSSLLDK